MEEGIEIMEGKSFPIFAATIMIILVLLLVAIFSFIFNINNINNLPKGELIKTVSSFDNKYDINIYLINGGATTDFAIRGEVINKQKNKKRNIYWKYHCNDAVVEWIDNLTVKINGKVLNVETDSYDYRVERIPSNQI